MPDPVHASFPCSWRPALIAVPLVLGLAACNSDGGICGDYPLTLERRQCMVETVDTLLREHWVFAPDRPEALDAFSEGLGALAERDLDEEAFVAALQREVATLGKVIQGSRGAIRRVRPRLRWRRARSTAAST